ncbi:MAG: preprotein translocase subunit SecG [Prevotella sp.]|nr:preprotein translocase subunit SecG [Prevotella sp.]MBR6191059.1 preprotein translocase subunit SecG [Prevotella sp.]
MYTLLVILIALASVLMIGIVLIQESKGGGLASGFSSANSVAGVRQTTKFIEKLTWSLAGAMVVISIACAWTAPSANAAGSVIENAATEQATTNPNNVQGFGATKQNQNAPKQDAKAAGNAAPTNTGNAAPETPAK